MGTGNISSFYLSFRVRDEPASVSVLSTFCTWQYNIKHYVALRNLEYCDSICLWTRFESCRCRTRLELVETQDFPGRICEFIECTMLIDDLRNRAMVSSRILFSKKKPRLILRISFCSTRI